MKSVPDPHVTVHCCSNAFLLPHGEVPDDQLMEDENSQARVIGKSAQYVSTSRHGLMLQCRPLRGNFLSGNNTQLPILCGKERSLR